MARKPNTAKTETATDASVEAAKAEVQRTNETYDMLIEAARDAINSSLAHETEIVKANQYVAWTLLRYRDVQVKDGVKPVQWSELQDSDSKARTDWRTAMATKFLGKAPPARGDRDQAKDDASRDYKARRRIFDDACDFCIALSVHGVTEDHYMQSQGCFAVPAMALVPKDDAWEPTFLLATAKNSSALVPLNNSGYRIVVGTDKARDIRASVKQVITAWKSKPAAAGENNNNESGRSDIGTLDPKVMKAVMDKAGIDRLARAVWAEFNSDPKAPMKADDFEPNTWNMLLNIAARINAMAATKAQLAGDKPVDSNAAKVKARTAR